MDRTLLTNKDMQMILAGLRSLDSVSGSRYYGLLMEKIKSGSSEYVSGSESLLIDLSSCYKESLSPKIEVIQNAVAIPDEMASWNDRSLQLLYLGVLIPRKGVQDLLDAMEILNNRGTLRLRNIRLIVGGTGDEMAALQAQCRRLHLEEYVEFC